MGDPPNDRRRAERVPVNSQFAELTPAYVSDLSEYGVFVHADNALPIGSVIDLQFTVVLDDPVILRGRGKVVRIQEEPSGMGIEFTDLDPEMILRINDVVTRQRPRDSGPPLSGVPDTERTTVAKIKAENLRLAPLPGEPDEDDPEAATTLVNLKSVDLEILEEEEEEP
jgi:Tfp pilus assembly protein PilZ